MLRNAFVAVCGLRPRTVLFIHGMWADCDCWARYQRVFEKSGYSTHALTLLHHDQPQDLAGLQSTGVMDYVDQAAAVVDSLPEMPIVVGHSMGGLVAQKLAERGNVRALVLLSSVSPGGISRLTPSSACFISGSLVDIALSRPFIVSAWHARFGLTNTLSRREQSVIYTSLLYESGLAMKQVIEGDIEVDESKVQCPVLVGVGGQDRTTPPRVARRIARKYDADYHQYNGKCHFVGGDRDIMHDVLAWCDRLRYFK